MAMHSANWFNYINVTNPDTSGMLRFVTDELQDAEDAGDRGSYSFQFIFVQLLWNDHLFQSGSLDMSLPDGMVLTVWPTQQTFVCPSFILKAELTAPW